VPALTDRELEDPQVLTSAAAEIRAMRRARDRLIPKGLVGEPAWDILLELLCEHPHPVPIERLGEGAGVRPTTAMRWVSALEAEGLVQQTSKSQDQQISVSLSGRGWDLVRNCLAAMLRSSGS
jgi:DNA-binding MarR family transcriptional regulator